MVFGNGVLDEHDRDEGEGCGGHAEDCPHDGVARAGEKADVLERDREEEVREEVDDSVRDECE